MRFPASLRLIVVGALTSGALASAQVQFVTLPDHYYPQHVSEDGTVVVGTWFGVEQRGLARWTLRNGLEFDTGYTTSLASGLSDDGQVALVQVDAGGIFTPAVPHLRTAGGVLWPLPEFAGPSPYPLSPPRAFLLSGDGDHVFGYQTFNPFGGAFMVEYFRWIGQSPAQTLCGLGSIPTCETPPTRVARDGATGLAYDTADQLTLWTEQGGHQVLLQTQRDFDISGDGATIAYLGLDDQVYLMPVGGTAVSTGANPTPGVPLDLALNHAGDQLVSRQHIWRPGTGWVEVRDLLLGLGASRHLANVTVVDVGAGGDVLLVSIDDFGNATYPGTAVQHAVVFLDGQAPGSIGESTCGPPAANSTSLYSWIQATGSSSLMDNALTIEGHNLPPGQFSVLLSARGTVFLAAPSPSIGTVCIGGGMGIGRHLGPGEVQPVSAAGDVSLTLDLFNLPSAQGAYAAQPGDQLYFQFWHRDVHPQGGPTSNFTDAVGVIVL